MLVSVWDITIIKSKYHFLLALSLGVTIIMSVATLACNNVIAQTLDTITQQRNQFNKSPQIALSGHVGVKCQEANCHSIAISELTNKIYITNPKSGTVSVIDSNSGSAVKNIRVGTEPSSIAVDDTNHKIYVAEPGSNTVFVIDGDNDSKIGVIPIGYGAKSIAVNPSLNKIYVAKENTVSVINGTTDRMEPNDIALGFRPSSIAVDSFSNKIYVVNRDNHTVSVIDSNTDMKEPYNITVGKFPTDIAVDSSYNKIYVVNSDSNTASVINGTTDRMASNIGVGKFPTDIAVDSLSHKIYVVNSDSNTLSGINGTTNTKNTKDTVLVGEFPTKLAVNPDTKMIYVVNNNFSTVSVIDGSSNKVAAGVTLNTHPANAGTIMCNKKEYPTNIYVFIDVGTNCTAQHNKDFEFSGWVENLNGNSTIPLRSNSSGNLTVNRYGTFTANFKPIPPADPTQFLLPLYGIIVSSIVGWSIPSIISWARAQKQRKYLKECINQIGKLDRNAIEEMITGYYVDGKISESHRQLLKDKIEDYEKVKGYNDRIDY